MLTIATFTQHYIRSPSHRNQARKRLKDIKFRKEDVRLSLFADNMILYIENPKDATKNDSRTKLIL